MNKLTNYLITLALLTINTSVIFALQQSTSYQSTRDQRSDFASIANNIKQLIAQDQLLQNFFASNESPEDFLNKSKIAAQLTHFPKIRQELNEKLNPLLEAALVAKQQEAQLLVRSGNQPTVDREAAPPCHHLEEIAKLKEELARMRAQENDRLDAEFENFVNVLEQTKKDHTFFVNAANEAKKLVLSLKNDTENNDVRITPLQINTSSQALIENARHLFAQQLTNLERCSAEMMDATGQLKDAYVALESLLNKQVIKSAEVRLCIKRIAKLVEEMQKLLGTLKETKTLTVQAKFDLERRYEAIKLARNS